MDLWIKKKKFNMNIAKDNDVGDGLWQPPLKW